MVTRFTVVTSWGWELLDETKHCAESREAPGEQRLMAHRGQGGTHWPEQQQQQVLGPQHAPPPPDLLGSALRQQVSSPHCGLGPHASVTQHGAGWVQGGCRVGAVSGRLSAAHGERGRRSLGFCSARAHAGRRRAPGSRPHRPLPGTLLFWCL